MLELRVFPDRAALLHAAADEFATVLRTAVAERGRCLVALSGGSTPQGLFKLLARPPYSEGLPWEKLIVLWGDERAVGPESSDANFWMARNLLLDHVSVTEENIYRIPGELLPVEAVSSYTETLAALSREPRSWPRLDFALMGMGKDGHTASLFPGLIPEAEAHSPVIATVGQYEDRHPQRISLTPLVFNDARVVLFLAVGEAKAKTLSAILEGPEMLAELPAQRIQPTAGVLKWFVDAAAAAELKIKVKS